VKLLAPLAQPRDPVWRWFVAALTAVTLLRLIGIGQWPLSGDEAYHWEWALRPQLGYYDHPPLHAWSMFLSTSVFGYSAWAIRLPNVLASTAMVLVLVGFARRLGRRSDLSPPASDRAAGWTGLIALLTPLHTAFAVYATGDAWVSLMWSWALWAGWIALEQGRARDWLHLGAALGCGVLAKFLILPLGMALALAVLVLPPYRRHLLRWQPWLLLPALAVVISPLVWWNWHHDWLTFAFNFAIRLREDGQWYQEIPLYLGSQMAAVTPLVWIFGVIAAARIVLDRTQPAGLRYCAIVILVPLLIFLKNAFTRRIGLHWPAIAYPALYVLLPLAWERGWCAPRWRRTTVIIPAVITGLALIVASIPPRWSVLPFMPPAGSAATAPAGETLGLPELAAIIRERRQRHQAESPTHAPVFLCSAQYGFLAFLRFALDAEPILLWDKPLPHGQQHRMWDDWGLHQGEDALFLTGKPSRLKSVATKLSDHFASVGEPEQTDIVVDGHLVNRIWIVPCRGFDGRKPEWE